MAYRRVGVSVGYQLSDRLAVLEDADFLEPGAGDVADVVAGEVGRAVARENGGDNDEEDHAFHRGRRVTGHAPGRWDPGGTRFGKIRNDNGF